MATENAPAEIVKLYEALIALPGVQDVGTAAYTMEDIELDHLNLPVYGDLPHATILRSNGGLDSEMLGQFFITLNKTTEAWLTLEFLSWQVRDWSRSGNHIQLRSVALPPYIENRVQLGTSLSIVIDFFRTGHKVDENALLTMVDSFANDLQESIEVWNLSWENGVPKAGHSK